MATYKITIKMDNEAFSVFEGEEAARILRDLADKVEDNIEANDSLLYDINGNRVGEAIRSEL